MPVPLRYRVHQRQFINHLQMWYCSSNRRQEKQIKTSSPIPATLMTEAIRSSETSVIKRATRRNIPKDDSLHSHRCENKVFLRGVLRLLVIVNVPSSPNLSTLLMEAIPFSETSVLIRATRHNIPEDGFFISRSCSGNQIFLLYVPHKLSIGIHSPICNMFV
jgi:hypothetical protein